MTDIAATLHNILGLDLKGRWVIYLLEVPSEIALVVVLPLDETADGVCEPGITDVASRLIHSALVAAFERWGLGIIE